MPTPDVSSILSNLGLAGFAMFILWKMAIMFVQREKEKDIAHAIERKEWAQRMDIREEAVRTLEKDIRNTFSTALTENNVIMEQVLNKLNK